MYDGDDHIMGGEVEAGRNLLGLSPEEMEDLRLRQHHPQQLEAALKPTGYSKGHDFKGGEGGRPFLSGGGTDLEAVRAHCLRMAQAGPFRMLPPVSSPGAPADFRINFLLSVPHLIQVDVEDLMVEFMDISAPFATSCLSRLRDEGMLVATARAHAYKVVKQVNGAGPKFGLMM